MDSEKDDSIGLLSEEPINEENPHDVKRSLASYFSFLTIQFAIECALLVAYCFGFSYVLTLPYCGFLFQCGCTWFWRGGINKCNIYEPRAPHCPWCIANAFLANTPLWGSPFLMLFVTYVCIYFFPRGQYVFYALMPPMVWSLFNFVFAFMMKVGFGYPYFIYWNNTVSE